MIKLYRSDCSSGGASATTTAGTAAVVACKQEAFYCPSVAASEADATAEHCHWAGFESAAYMYGASAAESPVYTLLEPMQPHSTVVLVLANKQLPRKRPAAPADKVDDAAMLAAFQEPHDDGRHESSAKKAKVARKGKYLLWQFLLLALLTGHSDLTWHADQSANPGVFAFKDPNSAAKRWGRYKENENMSYEKMSRCIRDYFTREKNRYFGVMQPDPGAQDPASSESGADDGGCKRRRLHFAFNLRHRCVAQFVRQHAAGYYHKLLRLGLVDPASAAAAAATANQAAAGADDDAAELDECQ